MARKRAPGGGRKPRGQYKGNSASLAVRVRPETREGLLRAAEQHGRSISQEMQRALTYWIECSEVPHIARLAQAVIAVAEQCESATGRRYVDDPTTASALRSAIVHMPELLSPAGAAPDPKGAKRIGKQAAEFVAQIFRKVNAGHSALSYFDDFVRLSKGIKR